MIAGFQTCYFFCQKTSLELTFLYFSVIIQLINLAITKDSIMQKITLEMVKPLPRADKLNFVSFAYTDQKGNHSERTVRVFAIKQNRDLSRSVLAVDEGSGEIRSFYPRRISELRLLNGLWIRNVDEWVDVLVKEFSFYEVVEQVEEQEEMSQPITEQVKPKPQNIHQQQANKVKKVCLVSLTSNFGDENSRLLIEHLFKRVDGYELSDVKQADVAVFLDEQVRLNDITALLGRPIEFLTLKMFLERFN